jgi:hypothetical protein
MDREAVLEDIRRVARVLDRDWVTHSEYARHGGFGVKKVLRTFARWNDAVRAAGLTPLEPGRGAHRTRKLLGAEDIITEIRRVARLPDKQTVSVREFNKHASFSERSVNRVFGTWSAAVAAAGLAPLPKTTRIPDHELEAEFRRVHSELGRAPTYYQFANASKFSPTTYLNRWGTWRRARAHCLGAEDMDVLPTKQRRSQVPQRRSGRSGVMPRRPSTAMFSGGQVFGAPLNFRGLRHEPVNEQGVVFLFGMVAQELGFLIDAIQTGYPDCTAKRLTKGGRYEAVRVEFEFKSSHFREQGHNPDKCDLIVCWQHDWRDCPLEVLELKSAIRQLDANV